MWLRSGESVRADVTFRLHRPVAKLVVELNLQAATDRNLLSFNSARDGWTLQGTPGRHTVSLTIPTMPIAAGQYFWNVRLWDAESGETLLDTPLGFPMVIDDGGKATGLLALGHEWTSATQPVSAGLGAVHRVEAESETGDRRANLLPG